MPCASAHHQRGAAVILALITVMLAAMIAASVIGSVGRSIDSASGLQDQSQARILARGAADWARNVLAADGMETTVDHTLEPWAVKIPPTPVGEGGTTGEVAGEIQDWSGRFNLNNLAPEGKPDLAATAQFARLLEALELSPVRSEVLADTLLAWIAAENADNYDGSTRNPLPEDPIEARPPHGPLVDIGELRAIEGFDPELVSRLQNLVVALPAPSKINVNTAPAEVLFAVTSGLDLSAAQVLVAERDRAWFKDMADFSVRLPTGATIAAAGSLDVKSRHFLVTGRARYGLAVVSMEVLLDRKTRWPEILWQRIE